MELPDVDIPHPNAVAYAISEAQVNAKLNGVVADVKWLYAARANGHFRDVKHLKRLVKAVYPLYDAAQLRDRRREVLEHVRVSTRRTIEAIVRRTNWIMGSRFARAAIRIARRD